MPSDPPPSGERVPLVYVHVAALLVAYIFGADSPGLIAAMILLVEIATAATMAANIRSRDHLGRTDEPGLYPTTAADTDVTLVGTRNAVTGAQWARASRDGNPSSHAMLATAATRARRVTRSAR